MTFYFGWPGDDSGRKNWLVKVPKERKSLYQDILDLFCQRSALIDQMKGKVGEADLFYAQEWSDQSYRPNARYMHLNNSIDIMSINLVEPVFDVQMCDALKYSVMGASTIGHEITHGFDSDGSLYNKLGKKEDWWTPADKQNFAKLQDAMVENFNRQGREFFRGFAYGWMENMSDDEIENYQKDEHAPFCLRVNGNVYLMDEFYRLFNIKSGQMYLDPKDRIEIW